MNSYICRLNQNFMKTLWILLLLLPVWGIYGQTGEPEMAKPIMLESIIPVQDSAMACCSECKTKPVFSAGARYYFNPGEKTRNTLAANGYRLDQEALEYYIRYGNLPKLYYYQQLGALRNGNYAAINGVGLKQDFAYNVLKNSTFIIRPYVEFGLGYFNMAVVRNVTTNSIGTVLNASIQNYFLDNFVFSGDVGLSLGVNFKIDKANVSLIANGGYLGNIPTEWKIAQSLAFRETFQIGSAYAGATLRIDMPCCSDSGKCCK